MNRDYFYFPPHTKQFYFSKELFTYESKRLNLKYIYAPYTLSLKFIWFLWRRFYFIRYFFSCSSFSLPDLFYKISDLIDLENCFFQINVGTKGDEQKMTILAYNNEGRYYFIKAGETSVAINLIENEANTLSSLPFTLSTPKVEKFIKNPEFAILVTNVIIADKLTNIKVNDKILSYLFELNSINHSIINGYIFCFSHGDCCPWNILKCKDGTIFFVDWELAGMFPLGYDIITYIFRTNFLLNPNLSVKNILDSNYDYIRIYYSRFGVNDVKSYIKLISLYQTKYVESKGIKALSRNWIELSNIAY